jgi:hypothetical protein
MGLLIVALLHLMATAALPFTHSHELPDPVVGVSATPLDTDGGPQQDHDLCTVCRTLVHAQVIPVFAAPDAIPAYVALANGAVVGIIADLQHSTLSLPRAPPLV